MYILWRKLWRGSINRYRAIQGNILIEVCAQTNLFIFGMMTVSPCRVKTKKRSSPVGE